MLISEMQWGKNQHSTYGSTLALEGNPATGLQAAAAQPQAGTSSPLWAPEGQISAHLKGTLLPIRLYVIYKAGSTILLRGKEGNKDKIASQL